VEKEMSLNLLDQGGTKH